jgi:hypothetical protein
LRRNCILKYVTEGKTEGRIEVKERRETKHKLLLDGLSKEGGCWNLKEKEKLLLKRLWVCREADYRMNEYCNEIYHS